MRTIGNVVIENVPHMLLRCVAAQRVIMRVSRQQLISDRTSIVDVPAKSRPARLLPSFA